MKKNILFILSMLFLFSGCKDKSSNSAQGDSLIIPIDKQEAQPGSLSDYVASVKYIPLETQDENLIRHLTTVLFIDDKVVVADCLERQILLFDKNGKYLHKIGNRGKGPEEYITFKTVMVDEEKRIIVYDSMGRKLVYYALDGKFLKAVTEVSDKALMRNIINLPNGNFLCYTYDLTPDKVGEKASGLWEIDSTGVFVRSYFTCETLYPVIYNDDNSYLHANKDGSISILDITNQKLLHLRDGKLTEYLSFEMKHDIRREYEGKTYVEKRDYDICNDIQEKGNYVFAQWLEPEQNNFHTVLSKQDHKSILISKQDFWDGKGKIPFAPNWFINSNSSDMLLTFISGPNILDILEKGNLEQPCKEQIEKIIAGKSETEISEMNPVLLLLELK